jgi:hypothetical protein
MMETLPRELRDMIYHCLHDPYIADPPPCVGPNEDTDGDSGGSINEAANGAMTMTPLDLRFSFLKRHYFQASYMGVDLVKELVNTHFKAVPFKIQAEQLVAKIGHREFCLANKFGLGCALGELLGRVKVSITSLHFHMTDILQPLMAIGNTDCLIELTAPKALTTSRCREEEEVVASSQQFLSSISLNLRRMTLKGYPVNVRYQGEIVFTANKRKTVQAVSNLALGAYALYWFIAECLQTRNIGRTPRYSEPEPSRKGRRLHDPCERVTVILPIASSHSSNTASYRYNSVVGRKPLRFDFDGSIPPIDRAQDKS